MAAGDPPQPIHLFHLSSIGGYELKSIRHLSLHQEEEHGFETFTAVDMSSRAL